ncbi:MFS transporter [Nonomuraea ferruginea]
MSRSQWSAVAVCVLLNVADGFDVLVMSFTAAAVSAEWRLSGTELGLLLSAGLVGMALGSLFLAPVADRTGRRPLILACLAVSSSGMLLSALAGSAVQLGLLRLVTGVGIGGVIAGSNVIAAEYANRRWRGLAVSLNTAGYAVGGTVGGVIAVVLQNASGWRSVFAFGGVATALLVAAVLRRLPESLDFLLTRRSPGALDRLNALLAAMRQPPLRSMPEPDAPAGPAPGLRQLLSPARRRNTLLTWAGFFTSMSGFYFVASWTPLDLPAGDAGHRRRLGHRRRPRRRDPVTSGRRLAAGRRVGGRAGSTCWPRRCSPPAGWPWAPSAWTRARPYP